MTRKDVILKAIEGKLSWLQAADILGITPRHIRRLKKSYEQGGWGGLRDHRAGAYAASGCRSQPSASY